MSFMTAPPFSPLSFDYPPSNVSPLFRCRFRRFASLLLCWLRCCPFLAGGCFLLLWFYIFVSYLKILELKLLPPCQTEDRGCFAYVLLLCRRFFSKEVRQCFRRRSGCVCLVFLRFLHWSSKLRLGVVLFRIR
ncbi:hypothetical protein MtrunA17_Chr6g0476851 [Medicago truncatula]|uniref:Transmembrane protein n=1 Tax=Medicago truncatula TaxID=3880 RepID=A0A396HHQ8_MEDTR|nr:hypothetical protein MtrunA17_Chr6g0476851 [Medicago truncatula]